MRYNLAISVLKGVHVQQLPLRLVYRPLHTSSTRWVETKPSVVEGAADISHSQFIHSASPHSDFNPAQHPSAGLDTAGKWEGKLSPTTSHLFKLILPLPTKTWDDKQPKPTAFLLHPSQPLSHLSRLIAGSLPPKYRNVDISYLALTGRESDLDTHLRNAEEEAEAEASGGERQEGGPFLAERNDEEGRWQEVSWSQSTDLSDFIKQSCLNEKFKIVISPTNEQEVDTTKEMTLEVVIPSFESRTTYLRKRLLSLTKELDGMTKKKKEIDIQAHKGARGLIIGGLVAGIGYWIAVVRWTFWTDAGWDTMEPVTWAVGFGSVLASAAFLAYHNREVSYSSLLDLSITARQRSLYEKHGLDIDRWTEMVAEAKTLRREIIRIAADYDIEWKGELENLAEKARRPLAQRKGFGAAEGSTSAKALNNQHDGSKREDEKVKEQENEKEEEEAEEEEEEEEEEKIDIDKTIDEADELASQSEEQRNKEKAAQRKGEVVEDSGGKSEGKGGKKRQSSEDRGIEKAEELARKKT